VRYLDLFLRAALDMRAAALIPAYEGGPPVPITNRCRWAAHALAHLRQLVQTLPALIAQSAILSLRPALSGAWSEER